MMVCMIGSSIYAQEGLDTGKDNYFSFAAGADIKNAIVGSKPTGDKPALDWTIEGHAVTENFDFGLGYEKFDVINYDRKWFGLGYHIPVCYIAGTDIKFSIQPSLEMSWIGREWNNGLEERTFFTPSLNVNWNWDLTDHWGIQLATNWLPRPDIRVIYNQSHNKYVLSEGVKIVYKIKNN